ncbi:MAG TPA: aminotransferase class III-fold pyridoxal phosphate-dependent enzyme [Gemmatimonadaceae bacterium]|nr:aminotransferase class III-fold pyridoxal phosphate-dependent enzyme [Gemmatimonadaceae bacterium]
MASSSSKRCLVQNGGNAQIDVARARGNYLYDTRRKKYIDFIMGWCVGNFGWARPALRDRVHAFDGPDYVYPDYTYKRWHELAQLLVDVAPEGLTRCCRATGGSEAVELALQAAMLHTGRRKFIAMEGAYHGNTLAAMSVGDGCEETRVLTVGRIKSPPDADALDRLETLLKRRDVAAVIMEPISINLGVEIPEAAFMDGLSPLCARYGTLIILDEIATGFGRTGRMFASEHYAVKMDMMTIAKAATGGAAGIGALLLSDELAETLEEHGNVYSTYGWHPLSVDVAMANVRWIRRNEKRLLRQVERTGEYFLKRLCGMPFPEQRDIRMRGLAIAVDVRNEDFASAVADRCRQNGLLLTAQDALLMLLPALNIDRATAKEGLDILEASL